MSLLEAAYKIYEYEEESGRVGVKKTGEEPLVPVSHMIANADAEIRLNKDGEFIEAVKLSKKDTDIKTIIPVTLESANRTSAGSSKLPHPLEDRLRFLAKGSTGDFDKYLNGLKEWEDFSQHPKLTAIRKYIEGGGILSDLLGAGIVKTDSAGSLPPREEKLFIRFSVLNTGDNDEAYLDRSLFESFIGFYKTKLGGEKGLCALSWDEDATLTEFHPKGTLSYAYGAKLISANDSDGFTYRGRFTKPNEAVTISYQASQKAHKALCWLTANQGVRIGKRTFLWYKPVIQADERPLIKFGAFSGFAASEPGEIVNFRQQLQSSLRGYKNPLHADDRVIVTALEAATPGRLSVTYYNELGAYDFAERVNNWYESMKYNDEGHSPNLETIVEYAFGSERGGKVKADDKLKAKETQRLLHCVVDGERLPEHIVRALVQKFGRPLCCKEVKNLICLRSTAFAAVKKYRNEKFKEEWDLALDKNCTDRSYLFGRLLAIAEKLENDTYDENERGKRQTNAVRLQAAFSQRPMAVWRTLEEKLIPYKTSLKKNKPGLEIGYEKQMNEIFDAVSPSDEELNRPLSELYVLGYYHQRTELYRKKSESPEENKNEGE